MTLRWLEKKDGTRVLQYLSVSGWIQHKIDANGREVYDAARSQFDTWENVPAIKETW